MDVNKLLKALDDDSNETLLNFTTKTIREMTLKILKELHLPRKETIDIFNKLRYYKYVDEMNDLKYGMFLRWIPIENPENIHLTNFLKLFDIDCFHLDYMVLLACYSRS